MKEKANWIVPGRFVHQDMLERLTESEKRNTKYNVQDWHSFGSYCTNAWRNHVYPEAVNDMDKSKSRRM